MVWNIEISRLADQNLSQLHPMQAQRILRFLFERVANLEDPRSIGEALRGSTLGAFWKYRVGDFRVIANIDDRRFTILVVRIGDRKDVYKR
jgi:mRNA interferase RelE/StbE